MNLSLDSQYMICIYFYTAWNALYVLLLPVFMSVIYIGFQEWRKPQTQSQSSATNPSDTFTFNLAALDILGVWGTCVLTGFFFTLQPDLALSGDNLTYMVQYGQILLHNLICLERYLAVVHPITYMRLKNNEKLIRNSAIVAVWLVSSCMVFVNRKNQLFGLLSVFIAAIISLVSITFFSVSVLCVLIHPGPGERGGDRRRIDQSKRRAFYTMMAITVVLLVKFAILFTSYMIFLSRMLNDFNVCILLVAAQWLNAPCSVVPPVLFLHRQILFHQKSRIKQ